MPHVVPKAIQAHCHLLIAFAVGSDFCFTGIAFDLAVLSHDAVPIIDGIISHASVLRLRLKLMFCHPITLFRPNRRLHHPQSHCGASAPQDFDEIAVDGWRYAQY